MERKTRLKAYLKMCETVSTLPAGVGGLPCDLPAHLIVTVDSIQYCPLYYEMKFKNGELYDVAVLHELKANSLRHVPLEKVQGI